MQGTSTCQTRRCSKTKLWSISEPGIPPVGAKTDILHLAWPKIRFCLSPGAFARYSWDIRDPDVGISRTKPLCKWPLSVVLEREWGRIWKNFMQENFGLIFRSLNSGPYPQPSPWSFRTGTLKTQKSSRRISRRALWPAPETAILDRVLNRD